MQNLKKSSTQQRSRMLFARANISYVLMAAYLAVSAEAAKSPHFNESISSPTTSVVSRVRKHKFGMYSYFFTQSTSATHEISEFAGKYGISNIVQYACLGIPPAHFCKLRRYGAWANGHNNNSVV